MAIKAKKLYFDVAFSGTTSRAFFPCTQVTATTPGDRYGALLDALEALTGGSNPRTKQQRAVSAWFVPAGSSQAGSAWSAGSGAQVAVDFVQPTLLVLNNVAPTRIQYLNPGGTVNTSKPGQDAIYGTLGILRHFSVRLRRPNAGTTAFGQSLRGTLYVQRQHSLEV